MPIWKKWLEERGMILNKHQDPESYEYAHLLFNKDIEAIFCEGKAGTGKTTWAILAGAYHVHNEDYKRIIYIRSPHTVGRELGFLEGGLDKKQAPYMKPAIDAMAKLNNGAFDWWIRQEKLICTTPTYERGTNYDDAFIIIDEAQNHELIELQTLYTRKHSNAKIVTVGSLRQRDNSKNIIYGKTPFEWYMEHYKGDKPVAHAKLTKGYRSWFADKADDIWDTINQQKQ